MLPVSGPLTQVREDSLSTETTVRWRQARPIDRVLPYTKTVYSGADRLVNTQGVDTGWIKNVSFGYWSHPDSYRYYTDALNRAIAQFESRISDSAGYAENIAQFGKTVSMFNTYISKTAEVLKAIKQKDLWKVGHLLEMDTEPAYPGGRRRNVPSKRKRFSQNVLAYEYGLKPLMLDVESTLRFLCEADLGSYRVRSGANNRLVINEFQAYPSTGDGYGSQRKTATFDVGVRINGRVRVTNPNLFLADRMGLIDIALPWKLIPFSFIVDWFVNVEQVVSSWSGHFGFEIDYPSWTWMGRSQNFESTYTTYRFGDRWESTATVRKQTAIEHSRQSGFPNPVLQVKPFHGFSLERGLQAASLIMAVLGK